MSSDLKKNYEISRLLDFYGELLTKRQKEIMEYYYNDDLSLSEVAEECGITRQGVRDAILKSEELLFESENRLGLLEKYKKTEESLNAVLLRLEALGKEGVEVSDITERIKALL